MKHKKPPLLNDKKVTQPSFKQLGKISWSILYRYLIFGLFITSFFAAGYRLGIGSIVDFFNFLISLRENISILGYTETLSLYSWPLFFLTLIRIFIGFIVTYVIFLYLSRLQYRDFALTLDGPPLMPPGYKKAILHISWAFYWRSLLLMIIYFAVSLLFMSPEWLVAYFGYIIVGFVALFFFIMMFVLKLIINKPFCGFTLIAFEKKPPQN